MKRSPNRSRDKLSIHCCITALDQCTNAPMHHTAIQHYIEGRAVPTLDRTFIVNFVNSTALSGITLVVPIATTPYVYSGLALDPNTTPLATKPVEPDVTERFITLC